MSFAVLLLSSSNISGDTGWRFEGNRLPAVDDAITIFPGPRRPISEVGSHVQPCSCAAWVLTVDPEANPAIRALRLD